MIRTTIDGVPSDANPSPDGSMPPVRMTHFTSTGRARREIVVLGDAVACGPDTIIERAPEGSEAQPDSGAFLADRAGAYVLNTNGARIAFVVVPASLLEVPGLGPDPLLTLRSIANHGPDDTNGIDDLRWDQCHESEHLNPLYGCLFTRFGGSQPTYNNNSTERPAPRAQRQGR